MHRILCRSLLMLSVLFGAGLVTPPVYGEKPHTAQTAGKPDISVGELEAMLRPLTKTQLEVEAAAWLKLLQEKATRISNAEIAVKFKNREIKAVQHAAEAVEDAQEAAAEAAEAKQDATSGRRREGRPNRRRGRRENQDRRRRCKGCCAGRPQG